METGQRLIAGAMSGTSADGVDVALTHVRGRGLGMTAELVLHHHRPYPDELRAAVHRVRADGAVALSDLARLAHDIADAYAGAVIDALRAARLTGRDLAAVAAHGQTLFHAPPLTIQWIDPALLAARVGCAVVSDFRRADCAAGGQGAPLVPLADYLLFRHATTPRALVNIGGIANVTLLPPAARPGDVVAFDTGPGNCVSDWLARQSDPAGPGVDVGGARGARGRVVPDLLERCQRATYFAAPAGPRSTDGPAMLAIFRDALAKIARPPSVEDQLATACDLTAWAIARAITPLGPGAEAIVSGGGIHNATLMARLRARLGPVAVRTTDDLGLPSAAKEALAFALLGAATLDGEPGNLPTATGASRRVVLGAITPAP